jgi:hypothetical protein
MNLHLLLMLLAFKSPIPVDSLGVLEQPQISAPVTMKEEKAWLWTIRATGQGNESRKNNPLTEDLIPDRLIAGGKQI